MIEVKRLMGAAGGSGQFIVATPEGSWRVSACSLKGAISFAVTPPSGDYDGNGHESVIAAVRQLISSEKAMVDEGRNRVNRMDWGMHGSIRRD